MNRKRKRLSEQWDIDYGNKIKDYSRLSGNSFVFFSLSQKSTLNPSTTSCSYVFILFFLGNMQSTEQCVCDCFCVAKIYNKTPNIPSLASIFVLNHDSVIHMHGRIFTISIYMNSRFSIIAKFDFGKQQLRQPKLKECVCVTKWEIEWKINE